MLGFNFLGGDLFNGEIAEIKGDMTIKLMRPPGEDLKFVVELPSEKQMTFIVSTDIKASAWPSIGNDPQLSCRLWPSGNSP